MAGKPIKDGKKPTPAEKLKAELETARENNMNLMARVRKMEEDAENLFLYSASYYQMKREIELWKAVSDLSDINFREMKGQYYEERRSVRQVFLDNQRLLEHVEAVDGEEVIENSYFAGITEDVYAVRSLREHEREEEALEHLRGENDAFREIVAQREEEIRALQLKIGEYQAEYDKATREELAQAERKCGELRSDKIKLAKEIEELKKGKTRSALDEVEKEKLLKKIVDLETDVRRKEARIELLQEKLQFYGKDETGGARSSEGPVKKARKKGTGKQGRPAVVDDGKAQMIRRLKEKGHSQREIAELVGCGLGTVNRVLKGNGKDNNQKEAGGG